MNNDLCHAKKRGHPLLLLFIYEWKVREGCGIRKQPCGERSKHIDTRSDSCRRQR